MFLILQKNDINNLSHKSLTFALYEKNSPEADL